MLFLILVLAQLILIPLVAITILRSDKPSETAAQAGNAHWEDVQLVDLPEGIVSSDGTSRQAQRR